MGFFLRRYKRVDDLPKDAVRVADGREVGTREGRVCATRGTG